MDGVVFAQAEMQQLKLLVANVAHSVGYPAGSSKEMAAGVASEYDALPVLATREITSDATHAEDAENWWMEQLKRGSLDASFAVLMFLVNREQAGMHRGLRELRLKLDQANRRQQPACLWWVLGHLLGKARSSKHQWNLQDHGIDGIAFPYLQRVQMIATKYARLPAQVYDCNPSEIAIPFLFHQPLCDLRLTLLDKIPLSWSNNGFNIPSYLSGAPMTQLRTLHLKIAYVESLHPILGCTPNLTTLSFTQIQSFDIAAHRWTDISILASALALVKKSLITLTLRTFLCGNTLHEEERLGEYCGPKGDAWQLRLSEFPNLRNITVGLTLLLGVPGSGRMTLAQALPVGLELLALVWDVECLEDGYWEWFEVENIVSNYVKERGKGVGGFLKKVAFLSEVENDFYDEYRVGGEWCPWPPEESIPAIELSARAAGVLIEYGVSHEHMRWDHDMHVACQTSEPVYELPRHSRDPVPTTPQIDGVKVQVWGEFDQQGLPIITDG